MLAKSSSTSYDTAWATPVTSSDLALKANLASPALTGTPTSTTASAGNNSTQIATTAYADAAVAALVDSAPATLNTLDELAAALGDDTNFATTTATAIGLKAPLASPALTGTPTAPTASAGTNTTQLATTEFVQVANPTGAVVAFAGSSAPTNWLLCYGQAVSRTTYAALFAVVSTTYGAGDGTTTFNLPDLRGRTVAGIDNMGGSAASRLTSTVLSASNTLGATGGTQTHTMTSAEMPSHTHIQNAHSHTIPVGNVHTFTGFIGSTGHGGTITYTAATDDNTATNQNTGGGGAHLNTQPTMVLNYIIKA
jgi:microcystin-dependent protein